MLKLLLQAHCILCFFGPQRGWAIVPRCCSARMSKTGLTKSLKLQGSSKT